MPKGLLFFVGSIFASFVVVGASNFPSAEAGDVVSVFPTGSVKKVQQITIRFSTDMVPMGDPRSHKDPFAIKCAGRGGEKVDLPKASARWIDNRNWSYDFAKPLGSGVNCVMTKSVDKDLAGQPVTALESYSFSTGGPAILSIVPQYGDIEPEQYFVLLTEGPVVPSSVEQVAYFEGPQSLSRIGVRIVTGPDREKVIRAAVRSNYQFQKFRRLLDAKPFATIRDLDSILVLAPKNRFAEESKVVLHWPKGILSASQVPVEEAQKFDFQVMPAFSAKFTCERVNPERPCNPILGMQIEFSRMVDRKLLKDVKLVGPRGASWTPVEFDKAEMKKGGYRDNSDFIGSLTFKAPFPAQTTFTIALPQLKDELGRSLVNQAKFPLEVKTDDYTPLVKFAATFGLLERNADPILPVSMRNVEKLIPGIKRSILGKSFVMNSASSPSEIIKMYNAVNEKDHRYDLRDEPLLKSGEGKKFELPKPGGERDFELVGIPLKEPGLHVVELASPKLGNELLGRGTMYVASAALVTNLGVHLKKGRESSAVWVTTLDQAKPVADAEVSIVTAKGKLLAAGKTDSSGIWRVAGVDFPCRWDQENSEERWGRDCEVFAFAKSGDDVSFVSSLWTRGIEDYRFNLTSEYLTPTWGPITAHAVLDRALLQAGETLHFKTYLREYTSTGFRAFPAKRYPKRVLIVHRASGKTFSFPFEFDAKTGSGIGEFKVPKDATLGYYEIMFSSRDEKPSSDGGVGFDQEGDAYDWSGKPLGSFLVAEYRLPLMSSTVKIQGTNLVQPKDVKVDLSANYLSGGPAKDLKVKVRASLGPGSFSADLPGESDYTFFSNPIKTDAKDGEDASSQSDLNFVFNQDTTLNSVGGAVTTIAGIPSVNGVRSLVVEMEYRDPNGEIKTGRSETKVFPSETIVGFKSESWLASAGKVATSGVIVSPAGKPVANHAYIVEAYRTEYITHRKRLVGGFYSYDSSSKTVSLGKVCSGTTDAKGRFECISSKLPSGSVTLQARAVDAKGRATLATVGVHVYEEGDFSWWTPSDSDRVDLLPEQSTYQPGETAKFVLRSPFPVSTVLVTVEREGVLEAFVRTVPRDKPVIEVPLKGHYAPNVYVSALALRGRVGDPKPTALVDLAKPSMKLGMTQIKVGWKAHELKVTVTPEKKRYQAREKANAIVKVTRADGSPLNAAESEVAIAVVDESIALLRKNWSLDLLSAMMGQRPLAVDTSSAQNQVIGKRHFGSKAKPPGGGGGVAGPENRELFDPMLLWLPRVKLDSKGEAKITIPLNDSLTSFRIAAVAHSGTNFFGSGFSLIETSKDLLLYSGFAPVVRDGDKIMNALTVRNTTAKPMQVDIGIASKQLAMGLAKIPTFELKANDAKTLIIPVTVPIGITELDYEISAKDSKSGSSDSLKVKTKVQESVPPQVLQATLFQLDKTNSIPVEQPKDAIRGSGGLAMDTRASLMAGLAGVKSYMEDYPYSCLEQKTSKAIALEDSTRMKQVISELPMYFDSIGLLGFFPSPVCGSPQLSRYVLTIAKANGYEIPATTLEKALSGLTAWVNGSDCRLWWHAFRNNGYRDQERILIMDVLSLYGKMQPQWLKTVNITPNLWKTTTLVALYQMLARELQLENREALMKQIENILRARVNYQGSLMNLQGGFDWESGWYLFSSSDQEAIQLFGLGIDAPGWQTDIGRMARGVTARQRKGVWDTTMANAWGVTNMRLFTKKFEKEKITGTTQILNYSLDWAKKPLGEKTQLPWPAESEKKPVKVSFTHQGTGKPWVLMQTKSAIPLLKPWDLGYSIVRKVTRVTQDGKGESGNIQWKNGDVANVELTVTAKYDHPWVVIRDPIPAGASHLGTGLDGESSIMDRAPKKRPAANEVNYWPADFDEKTQSHFNSYAPYLMKGTYRMSYRIRLNSTGTMKLPPSRVEAMYSPETFGEAPIANWVIAP